MTPDFPNIRKAAKQNQQTDSQTCPDFHKSRVTQPGVQKLICQSICQVKLVSAEIHCLFNIHQESYRPQGVSVHHNNTHPPHYI